MLRRYLEADLLVDEQGNPLPPEELISMIQEEIGNYDVAAQSNEGIMLCYLDDFIRGVRQFGSQAVDMEMGDLIQQIEETDVQKSFIFMSHGPRVSEEEGLSQLLWIERTRPKMPHQSTN
jgi:hypothetical protein